MSGYPPARRKYSTPSTKVHESTVPREPRVPAIACTAADIEYLAYCRGCFEAIPNGWTLKGDVDILTRRDEHEAKCVAYAGFVVAEKLAAQARDDGRHDEADEIMEPYLI